MSEYLEQYSSLLSDTQKKQLAKFLNIDDNAEYSEAELEAIIEDAISKLGNGISTFEPITMENLTSSEKYNIMLRALYVDLYTLFNESNNIDKVIKNNHKLNLSFLKRIEKQIDIIDKKIEAISLIADNNVGFSSVSKDSFIDGSKLNTYDANLYKDRNGEQLSLEHIADIKDGSLSLSGKEDHNPMHGAKIEIIKEMQTGEAFSNNSVHSIDQAIDNSEDTFWGEVILSDEIMKVPISVFNTNDTIQDGAICGFKITFQNQTYISEIMINPYTEFPLDIVAIGYNTDGSNNVSIENMIKSYDDGIMQITDKTTIKFQEVECKAILFLIRQKHCTKAIYEITHNLANNTSLWNKVSVDEVNTTTLNPLIDSLDKAITDTINSTDYDITNPIDQLKLMQAQHMKHMLNPDRDVFASKEDIVAAHVNKYINPTIKRHVEKYEYVYGAYDIKCSSKAYKQTGIYVSTPHIVEGTVKDVLLEVTEKHPVFKNQTGIVKKVNPCGPKPEDEYMRRTSIEYYVTNKENPSDSDWKAILPLGLNFVNNELVFFNEESRVATLRFLPDTFKPYRLYKDEIEVEKINYRVHSDGTIDIDSAWFMPTSVYTIDYYPTGEYSTASFFEDSAPETELQTIEEIFDNGTDKNMRITLSKYPYVDYSKINDVSYNPVEVSLKGNIQLDRRSTNEKLNSTRDPEFNENVPAYLLNVTDYAGGTIPYLNPYNPKLKVPRFEYLHDGRELQFTETFVDNASEHNYGISHGRADIIVNYKYLSSSVIVKIIMRRTSARHMYVTPELLDYTLRIKSIK